MFVTGILASIIHLKGIEWKRGKTKIPFAYIGFLVAKGVLTKFNYFL
jgi:hypothetical protein